MNKPHSIRIQHTKMHGFTLTELMMTVFIFTILTAVAIPSFRSFILEQRIKSASFDLMSTLTLARSEAIKRNASVNVTPVNGNWANGWTLTAGGTNVSNQAALASVSARCYSGASVVSTCPTLTYLNNGRLSGANAPSIQLSGTGSNAIRCIAIDLSGRPNSKKASCP